LNPELFEIYGRVASTGNPERFEIDFKPLGISLLVSVYSPTKGFFVAVFDDITERKRAEEALRRTKEELEERVRERTQELLDLMDQLEKSRSDLRELASELVLSEERERKRIATVLHDEICQTLAVAKMRVDMLQKASVDKESTKTIREASEFLAQSIREARALMNEVGNPLLFDMGVAAACSSLAERLMAGHPVRIRCDIQDSLKDLDPDVKAILYQVTRELLNNVVKHSGAHDAGVAIRTDDGLIHIEVRDDGVGFDPRMLGAPTAEGGFGLFSIQERLKAFHAHFRIESAPGKGTVVKASIPLGLGRSAGTGSRGKMRASS
jgi:signal transduction histidine kinase